MGLVCAIGLSACMHLSIFSADRKHRQVGDDRTLFPLFLEPLKRNSLEWWYLNGHLQDSSENSYAFHSALFRRYCFPYGYRWMLNTAFSDIAADTTYRSYEIFRKRDAVRSIFGYDSKSLRIGNHQHQLQFDPQHLRAQYLLDVFNGSIEARPQTPLLAQAPGGMMTYMDGMQAGYLSYPFLPLNGQLQLQGKPVTVQGEGWFDRQWNALKLTKKKYRWDWLSISTDQFRLMIFRTVNARNGEEQVQGSWMNPDGSISYLNGDSILLHADEFWTSPQSGRTYPMQWQVLIPSRNLRACVDARIHNGELALLALGQNFMTYWEGPCSVWGVYGEITLEGKGFLEMTNAPTAGKAR